MFASCSLVSLVLADSSGSFISYDTQVSFIDHRDGVGEAMQRTLAKPLVG